MNIPDFKSILQKLSIFKNNLPLLGAVIAGVVAIILFIPTQLISSKLREQITKESISKGKRVKNIKAISDRQWQVEQEYQRFYENDANQIALLAKQSSQRQLLSYRIFPKPKDTSALIFEEFGQRFRAAAEQLIVRINARDCPTETELERSLQSSPAASGRLVRGGERGEPFGMSLREPYGSPYREGPSRRTGGIDTEIIVDEICRERAKAISAYANPTNLSGYNFWGEYKHDTGMEKAVETCWYWQLGYWIIEDVIDTIVSINSGSNSVSKSPVKRLMEVNFSLQRSNTRGLMAGRRGGLGTRAQTEGDDKPTYVTSPQDALATPCTGRFSNDDIDVIHFNLSVVVSTKAVLSFMQELCTAKEHKFSGFTGQEQERTFKHNQITILESNIKAIDRKSIAHNRYRYGEDAVVELNLICEYLFNKTGYEEIKPEVVKKALKGENEANTQ